MPRDIAVRWSVFGFLYALLAYSYALYDEDGEEPFAHPDVEQYLEELSNLVRTTTDPADLSEAKTLRWEVMNSCMLGEFALAERLIDRLDAIEPHDRGKHSAIRGQVRFSRWYANPREEEPLRWVHEAFRPIAHGR